MATSVDIGHGHYAVVEANEEGHEVKWHCPRCEETAKNKAGLKSHLRSAHPGWEEGPPTLSQEELLKEELNVEENQEPQEEPWSESEPEELPKPAGETGATIKAKLEKILAMPDEELAAKPRRFACNRFPSLAIATPKALYRFQGGSLTTQNPELIRAVIQDPKYGIHIFPDDPELYVKRR